MVEHAGKVYLVGSGPGDAAYLTLQAQAVLARAEVLVYDALVDGDLIDLVPDTCVKLDVGKRGGQPSTSQSDINRLLVEYCQQGKVVVRLKNGDPFIFGRAQSEIGALKKHRCDFEIVPGLSSALVAPLMAGIPLTDPQLSQGFTVVTAHNPDILNWVSLAKLDTLVLLMGGRTLPEIVRRLRGHGRSPATPIAIIRYAGRSEQQTWEGTLGTILDQTVGISLSPCVIVIGEVVKLRAYVGEQGQRAVGSRQQAEDRRQKAEGSRQKAAGETQDAASTLPLPDAPPPPRPHATPLPLTEKTIVVTRAVSQSSQFTTLLQAQGARVIELPTLEIGPPSSWRELDRAIDRIDDFDWLILTSANAVDYFFQRLEEVTGERAFYSNIKIAVVGEKTAQRLLKLGLEPDFVPPNFVAEALVAYFPEPLAGLRVLFARVESGGREVLVKEFTSQGAKVRQVAAYESRCPEAIAPAALKALQSGNVDVVTFASAKTVQHFCQLLQQVNDDWQTWLTGVTVASIGPQTSKACLELLGRVDVAAAEYTLEGLTQAIVDWFTSEPGTETDAAVPTEADVPSTPMPPLADLSATTDASADAHAEPMTPASDRTETQDEAAIAPPEQHPLSPTHAMDLLEPIQVELVPTDHLNSTPSELVATEAELIDVNQSQPDPLTAEVELIAEIQAVVEQGEQAES